MVGGSRRFLLGLTGALLLTAGVAGAAPPEERPVSYGMKVAGKGSQVRIRRVYRRGAPKPGPEAPMPGLSVLDQGNYDSVKWFTKEILVQFPPNKYFYVGVGRSPSAVISMLKNLGPDLAVNFPSSDMKFQEGQGRYEDFADNYRQHIEALIPASVRRGNRKILLIDWSPGRSPKALMEVFTAYRRGGGAMPKMEVLSLGWGNHHDDVHAIDAPDGNEGFTTDKEDIAEFIGEQSDKGHIIHSEGGTLAALRRNPAHAEHRRLLFKRMRSDKDLDDFLRKTFPRLTKKKPAAGR